MSDRWGVVAIYVGVLVVVAGLEFAGSHRGYRVGYATGVEEEREQAIAAGVARWKIDPKTGEKRFVYGKE